MPRKAGIPNYKPHKNGQGYCKWKGEFHYFGKFGTPESHAAYRRFLAEIADQLPQSDPEEPEPSKPARKPKRIISITVGYSDYTAEYYGTEEHNSEHFAIGRALSYLLKRYKHTVPGDIGPSEIQQLQRDMVDDGLSRGSVNQHIGRVKRFFRWMVNAGYIQPSVLHAVQSVTNLRKGRTKAPEPEKVRPVPLETVQATLPWLNPVIRSMVQIQLYCGMRPQDVCRMRPMDLDRSGSVWLYLPESHKNDWRNQELIKGIPQIAQEILAPFLNRNPDVFCFSPREAVKSIGRNTNLKAKTKPGDCYNVSSYCKGVKHGFVKAKRKGIILDPWFPMQLRHTIATLLSQRHGEQTAQRWLGHARLETTGIYSERQRSEIIQIAALVDQVFSIPPAAPESPTGSQCDDSTPPPCSD